jgi:regulator of protease activity HflC (stomatin/prohibitin superfamily)
MQSKLAILLVCLALCIGANALCTRVPTGHVGLWTKWGTVIDPVQTPLDPGLHCYNPMAWSLTIVETRPQTDTLPTSLECRSNDGIILVVDKVEVGNQLPKSHALKTVSNYGEGYDRFLVLDEVKPNVADFCSRHTAQEIVIDKFEQFDDFVKGRIQQKNDDLDTGLQISFVRITTPRFPADMQKHFQDLANEKTRKKVLEQQQESEKIRKATEQMVARRDNDMKMEAVRHENDVLLSRVQARREEQTINNQIIVETAKANAEKLTLEAQALQAMHNVRGYVELKQAEALSHNTKVYWGDKLPNLALSSIAPIMQEH